MQPNPLALTYEERDTVSDFGVLQVPAVCALCLEGFPFWHALICSCKHLYHPWCAAAWFRDTSDCASADCGRVHPMWLKACGFSYMRDEDRSGATADTISGSAAALMENVGSLSTPPPPAPLNSARK